MREATSPVSSDRAGPGRSHLERRVPSRQISAHDLHRPITALLWSVPEGSLLGRISAPGHRSIPRSLPRTDASSSQFVLQPSAGPPAHFAIDVWDTWDLSGQELSRWMRLRHDSFVSGVLALDRASRRLAVATRQGEIVLIPLDPVAFLRADPPRPLSRLELLRFGLLEGK